MVNIFSLNLVGSIAVTFPSSRGFFKRFVQSFNKNGDKKIFFITLIEGKNECVLEGKAFFI